MRFTFTLITFLLAMAALQAQDPRLSQFYAAPLEMNPAMTGVFEGRMRFVANYRDLYPAILDNNPYRTIAASFDMRFRVQQGDFFAVGLNAMRDEVGLSGFNRSKAHLGASFMKQLGGSGYSPYTQYLVAGAQVGFGQHGLNWQRLWFSRQFNEENGTIDFGGDNGEGFEDELNTDLFLDFNAGLLWYITFDDNLSYYVGGSLMHLNQPNISFAEGSTSSLDMRWVAHTGGELPLAGGLSLLPAVAVMGQGKHFSTTVGANFRYTNRDWREVAIRAGGWAHLSNQLESGVALDAIVATTVLEMDRWNIGLSYDVTTSVLKTANNSRGAFEVSFIYVQPASWRTRVNCPNF
ncbi:PorP/SprF family type IX secretion system membrane protein [Phaeodactylibacter luteus]|uniref:Type IX secretion system membrane protein PorP/SprF n=1 Tax=Phaeodactylibacter luteus TaxID=1564516 RepID=A0A5C6RKQ3_9BACT|nr:PorP/SprF family type IX secretion system membrane protein [Phaeodactylibacter luteus]TXB62190.1 type IX secretion system membrane protein PorP/SprF [Phaeodactylibacter luteus]